MTIELCPAQQAAFDRLNTLWSHHHLFILSGHSGRSTVLQALHQAHGGQFLTARHLVRATMNRHPLQLEEAFSQVLREALEKPGPLFLDDLPLLTSVIDGCGSYPRNSWITAHLEALRSRLQDADRKLALVYHSWGPSGLASWAVRATIGRFEAADYGYFGRCYLGEAAERLDFARIHRFAPYLDGHQLRSAGEELRGEADVTTERFIEYLREQELTSNVDLEEVQPVTLRDLQGIDEVVQALETHIVLPLENDELARKYQLKPKRGVLLAGPPGTGKTTVGRALAHRLRGKFFLLDGTLIPGTERFYYRVEALFDEAKRNAPSVLFIDDCDVIFAGGAEQGLYRFLLTMLDGLESASAGRVCVMLTAMDVGQLPAALLRSGRVELWLEMRLPDEAGRAAILGHHLSGFPEGLPGVDVGQLADLTPGCTGADLKRLAEDGRNLFASDLVQDKPLRPATAYFLDALATLRANQEKYGKLAGGR